MGSVVKLPLKLRVLFAINRFILRISFRQNGTINRWLLKFVEFRTPPSKTPRNGVISSDTVIDATRNQWFRLFIPSTAVDGGADGGGLPIIVYYHGGGFVMSSPDSSGHDKWCRRMAKDLHAVVVSMDYRFAPEHRYPTQYEDAFDALKFLDDNLESLPVNVNPKLCFLAGDSAGGNVAHHVAVEAGACEFSRLKVIGLIAIQPFFGGEERTGSEIRNTQLLLLSLEDSDWCWKAFLPSGSNRDHPAANVWGPKSTVDISRVNYPATLLLIGRLDILSDWQRRYYDWLKSGGKEVDLVEHPDAFHGSFIFDEFPVASYYMKETQGFMQKRIEKELLLASIKT